MLHPRSRRRCVAPAVRVTVATGCPWHPRSASDRLALPPDSDLPGVSRLTVASGMRRRGRARRITVERPGSPIFPPVSDRSTRIDAARATVDQVHADMKTPLPFVFVAALPRG